MCHFACDHSRFDTGIQITNRPTTRAAHFSSHAALGFATGSLNFRKEGGEGKNRLCNQIAFFVFCSSIRLLLSQKAQGHPSSSLSASSKWRHAPYVVLVQELRG